MWPADNSQRPTLNRSGDRCSATWRCAFYPHHRQTWAELTACGATRTCRVLLAYVHMARSLAKAPQSQADCRAALLLRSQPTQHELHHMLGDILRASTDDAR